MNTNNGQVNLPSIQHVLKGLFKNNQAEYQKHCQRPSPFGYDSTIEAARSLQKMSSAGKPCYHFPPATPYQGCQFVQFNRAHRRTVSASIEIPFSQPIYPHAYSVPQVQQPQHQDIPFPRRARAHTTSGYPPTIVHGCHQNHPSPLPRNPTAATSFETPNPIKTVSHPLTPRTKEQSGPSHRYHCRHCGKTFSRPSSLRIHIYSHTGEKPFKCNHQGCGRSFSVHSNMRRHLRVHYYPEQQHKEQQEVTSMRLPIIPSTTTRLDQ